MPKASEPSPVWALSCKNCGEYFSYSRIGSSLSDYFFPVKPQFAQAGERRRCPKCQAESIYQQEDLYYRLSIT